MKTLLLALLFLSPAVARADLVFKCRAVTGGSDLTANLRFDERGRGGRIEVDRWTGYPPTPLVYADLKGPEARGGRAVYVSETDSNSGARAEISLPLQFLTENEFRAALILPPRAPEIPLACERF